MTGENKGNQLENRVETIYEESEAGRLTSDRAVQATRSAIRLLNQDRENIVTVNSFEQLLTPLVADYFGGFHGDKYAKSSMFLARQFSDQHYVNELAETKPTTHYLIDDFGANIEENTNRETSMIRRGIDAVFVSGMLRHRMENEDIFKALGQPYFKEMAQQGLPLADSVMGPHQGEMYTHIARNFDEVTDTLAYVSRDLFNQKF